MGQRPNELTPHESLRHYWGAELRALRQARGLPLAELGRRLHCDPSYLAKIERAERRAPVSLVENCDRALDAAGTLLRLHDLAESGHDLTTGTSDPSRGDVDSDEAHVASAAGNLDHEIVVPARTADGRVVFVSVSRRVFLHGLSTIAIGLAATPEIAASTTPLPDQTHPVEHFQRLREILIENSMLFGPQHVIPAVREQIGVMQRLLPRWRGADKRALVGEQARYTEFCGWLHKDVCEHQEAENWMDRALGLSHQAADQDLTAYVLASKAELAGDMRRAHDAIDAGEQAARLAPPHSQLAALAATRAARGHAINGDRSATERTYDRARQLLDSSDTDPEAPGGQWLTDDRITLSQAHSWTFLGEYRRAAESFEDAIRGVPDGVRLSRGSYLARAALAHAGDRDVEQAAALGTRALTIGADTGSGRILTDIVRLDDALARWHHTPAVTEFRTAVRDTLTRQAAAGTTVHR